jgi:hypothetical protein
MVIVRRQVLDLATPASDGVPPFTRQLDQEITTMDPAVLGTLRIGLEAIDAEVRPGERRRTAARSRAGRAGVRARFAAVLRRAAALLEPRPVGEASS